MERLDKCAKRAKKVILIFALYTSLFLWGCNTQSVNPNFSTVFEAYKRHGEEGKDERYARVMSFLHDYNSKSLSTGIEYIANPDFTESYGYIAFCYDADFKHLNFVPLSDKHRGIAYVYKVDEYDPDYIMDDSLKIYFPNTLQAKGFMEDAINYGFEYLNYKNSEDTDSVSHNKACYRDPNNMYVYSLRILSEIDSNVVILHYCP